MKQDDLLIRPRHCSEIDMKNKSHLMLQKTQVLTLVKGLQFLFKKRAIRAIRVEGSKVSSLEDTPRWRKSRWARARIRTSLRATSDKLTRHKHSIIIRGFQKIDLA